MLIVERLFFLKKVSIFRKVHTEILSELSSRTYEISVPKETQLIKKGEYGNQLFLIVSGSVSIQDQGKEIQTIHAKGFFGELALLSPAPRSSDVFAIEDTLLLCLDRKDFLDACTVAPEILFGVVEEISDRLRKANKKSIEGK